MLPHYEDLKKNLEIFHGESGHIRPHLHKSLECIYVTEGTLELGIGQELYHMEKHDFAMVFPELIHHYQVFDQNPCREICLLSAPPLFGQYHQILQKSCPKIPVIPSSRVHSDIPYALYQLLDITSENEHAAALRQAYTQIILARALPHFQFVDKSTMDSDDIIYRVVAYIAAHFTEEFSLTQMAEDLGYSPYALSRVFSGTFHCNFNTYLNNIRLDYACSLLLGTDQTITEAFENAGFGSQRTFNRIFRERYHMSPRDYRNSYSADT